MVLTIGLKKKCDFSMTPSPETWTSTVVVETGTAQPTGIVGIGTVEGSDGGWG